MRLFGMRREAAAFRFLVLALLAVLVMAGCGSGTASGNGDSVDEEAVQTSPEAARSFVEKVVATGQEGADGSAVTLTVTEEEVSSFLDLASKVAREAAAQGADSLSDLERMDPDTLPEGAEELPQLLRELRTEGDVPDVQLPNLEIWSRIAVPRVHFAGNGQIVVAGLVDILGFPQQVRIVAVPRTEGDKVLLTFVEGRIGRLPMPTWLANQLITNVDDLVVLGQDYAGISDVVVTEGEMTVTGRLED